MRLKASVQRTSWIMVFVLLGFFASTSIHAQQEKETPKSEGAASASGFSGKLVQRIFEVKFADVDRLAEMLRLFGPVFSNRELRVITVSGSPELVAAVEDAIRRFDVPQPATKNIELTAYLLVASSKQGGSNGTPSELEGVIKQLRNVFSYQGFHLLDTLVVRCRNGNQGGVNGIAPKNSEDDRPTMYRFGFDSASLTSDGTGQTIHINNLRLGVTVWVKIGPADNAFSNFDTAINTNVDVREGQRVVVGKATIDGSNNALFLVLTAKVVD